MQDRRNDYDVTNTVQVSNPAAVRNAVQANCSAQPFPGASYDQALARVLRFRAPLHRPAIPATTAATRPITICSTHLDMTLAHGAPACRPVLSAASHRQNGWDRKARADGDCHLVCFMTPATFDTAERDRRLRRTAQNLRSVTCRAAQTFCVATCPNTAWPRTSAISSMIVHFTGYELDLDKIELDDPRDVICGHMLGTADLIAQMADRCYLEKCRDRLYKEFVLGGIAIENAGPGEYMVRYESGVDLLTKTPDFYQQVSKDRLQTKFNRAYRYIEPLFGGENPYILAIRKNMLYLMRLLKTRNWGLLRRNPPYFVAEDESAQTMDRMVQIQLANVPPEHRNTEEYLSA